MARSFFYYGALRKSIIQFCDVFNEIKIAKYNANGDVEKYVTVPIKYMPKSKFYMWVNDRKHEIRLPSIGIELTSILYDQERASGVHETVDISISDFSKTYTANTVPYNLTFSLNIITKYQHEMDMINEQILPWFNPMIVSRVTIDDLNLQWDMPIILEDASMETEADIGDDELRTIRWTHTYLVKTSLVKPISNAGLVEKVVNKFYLTEESLANRDTTTDAPSGVGLFDEELLTIGYKVDDEIMARYKQYGNNI